MVVVMKERASDAQVESVIAHLVDRLSEEDVLQALLEEIAPFVER